MKLTANKLLNSKKIESFSGNSWTNKSDKLNQKQAIKALESGKVVFFPELKVMLDDKEKELVINAAVKPGNKNVSYDYNSKQIRGSLDSEEKKQLLANILENYVLSTLSLIKNYFPQYSEALQIGRTSLRPIEIQGRISPSYKKDDTRLHVDAFPSSPKQGRRILRVFSNINYEGKPRVWRLGEDFADVAKRFFPKINSPIIGISWFMEALKITRGKRTPYDHYMLNIHDNMKYDLNYQNTVKSETVDFPANSSWVVFTDQVSHAALSGQHLLEQTFYLPVDTMLDPSTAPLTILEKLAGRKLV
jgi:hypothetical protein